MLLRNVSLVVTYFHLVIKSKFPMLPNATRKGNPRFTTPLHVRENLLSIIEERQSYCHNRCTKIQNYEIKKEIGFKKSCVFLVCWLYLLVNLAYMFHVGYFRLGLGYSKSYNFCSTNFEVAWAKYFVVLTIRVLNCMQFQLFFQLIVTTHYTIHEFSHMYENGCLLHVFVANYFVLMVAVFKWT